MKGILRPERELSCQSVNSSKIDVIKHKTNCFQSCIEKCVKTNNQENAHRRNNVCSFRDCLTKHSIQQIIQRRMSGWRVNSSLEGTWKETVDYFEGFSLNQSDQSVTEPRSESGYFRLLSGTIANASTGTSGKWMSQNRRSYWATALKLSGLLTITLCDSRPVSAYFLKHVARDKNVRLSPRNLNKYVLILFSVCNPEVFWHI